MDNTDKEFFHDSMKFFLSLYGHSLPNFPFPHSPSLQCCVDFSWDCSLLVSGSADKTIKIWGLDFGDCENIYPTSSVPLTFCRPGTNFEVLFLPLANSLNKASSLTYLRSICEPQLRIFV